MMKYMTYDEMIEELASIRFHEEVVEPLEQAFGISLYFEEDSPNMFMISAHHAPSDGHVHIMISQYEMNEWALPLDYILHQYLVRIINNLFSEILGERYYFTLGVK